MTGAGAPFRAAYAAALGTHLRGPTEASLHAAYELARDAVRRQLSVLDLAVVHQEALHVALDGAANRAQAQRLSRTAGDFFLEGLATFEMVQRGSADARRAALRERRQTERSRLLSSFLADASLALEAPNSIEEMLRLVAEHARELAGAACCLATVSAGDRPRSAEAASHPEHDRHWVPFVRWLDLGAVYRLLDHSGGSVRIAGEELAGLPPFRAGLGDPPVLSWLAASLSALDGSALGAIQLFDKPAGPFTREDEAALVHLARTASAAVERAQLYRGRSSPRG